MQYCPKCGIEFRVPAILGSRCPNCGRKINFFNSMDNLFPRKKQKFCINCGKEVSQEELKKSAEIAKNYGFDTGPKVTLPCPKCAKNCWKNDGPL